ncbi:hypothetical protein TNCT_554001 [Trichonephila clavata]|uniref:Uncharacterized protein n=1 Tax=Trichonephila clavata TaxID=2740835 RepID=A0A8X6KV93_TRICU|nr:hypothetical protein TNCT_554001 [Trichonephila clavata]
MSSWTLGNFRKDGPKAHWFLSRLNKKSSQHCEPITENGKLQYSPTELTTNLIKNYAAIIRPYISSKDRKQTYEKSPTSRPNGSFLLKNDFSYGELPLAASSMKKGKSAGHDEVLAELILHLVSLALRTFLNLINLTLKTRVPHQ